MGFEGERVPSLAELLEILPSDIGLALELKSDRFLEEETCQRLAQALAQAGVRERTVILSFSLDRLLAVRQTAPDLPIGWITLSRAWPIKGVEMIGPLWPWLFLNPLYVTAAHRRSQLICPLDPNPDKRIPYYRFLGCDAILSDNPGQTAGVLR
jgi:glycerophosphoryl diester phosphodiesterase